MKELKQIFDPQLPVQIMKWVPRFLTVGLILFFLFRAFQPAPNPSQPEKITPYSSKPNAAHLEPLPEEERTVEKTGTMKEKRP